MSDFNPNQTLPGNVERVSVNEFTKNLTEADEQAKRLAKKASNIWKKFHPDDPIKTDAYDASDFLDENHCVHIPDDVNQMFEEYERKQKEEEEEKKEPTKEEIQKAVLGNTSAIKDEDVKKNPVLDKLMVSFGLQKEGKLKTVSKTINGINFTFEYPSSMTAEFAFIYANSNYIGMLDISHGLSLMKVALSIVEIDGSPITSVLNISDEFEHYSDIPNRVRKICAVRLVETFLEKISEGELQKIMKFYEDTIGSDYTTEGNLNPSEFVEVKCPECGKTDIVAVEDGKIPDRYCRFDGKKMEVQSSNKTDANAPLA